MKNKPETFKVYNLLYAFIISKRERQNDKFKNY